MPSLGLGSAAFLLLSVQTIPQSSIICLFLAVCLITAKLLVLPFHFRSLCLMLML